MDRFNGRHGVSIAQVVLFSASLIGAGYLKKTHRPGWVWIGLFSVIRILGAALLLATRNAQTYNTSYDLVHGAFILESLGIFFLIFLILDLLQKANKHARGVVKPEWLFQPQLLTCANVVILSINFIAYSRHGANPLKPTILSKFSYGLLITVYVIVVCMCVVIDRYHSSSYQPKSRQSTIATQDPIPDDNVTSRDNAKDQLSPYQKHMLARGPLLSLVFLAAPIVHAALYQFSENRLMWSPVSGTAWIYAIMVLVPEVVVLLFCGNAISVATGGPGRREPEVVMTA